MKKKKKITNKYFYSRYNSYIHSGISFIDATSTKNNYNDTCYI